MLLSLFFIKHFSWTVACEVNKMCSTFWFQELRIKTLHVALVKTEPDKLEVLGNVAEGFICFTSVFTIKLTCRFSIIFPINVCYKCHINISCRRTQNNQFYVQYGLWNESLDSVYKSEFILFLFGKVFSSRNAVDRVMKMCFYIN